MFMCLLIDGLHRAWYFAGYGPNGDCLRTLNRSECALVDEDEIDCVAKAMIGASSPIHYIEFRKILG